MSLRDPNRRLIPTLVILSLIALWIFFAPRQVGGWTSYVIVTGSSMEPMLLRDDVVLVREAAAYQVGDVVTYQNPQVGPVIHRIIDQVGARWVLKGDHNTWTDAYRPTQLDIIGTYWFRIPGAGRALAWMREPLHLGLLTALASGVFLGTWLLPAQQRRKKRKPRPAAGKWMDVMDENSSLQKGIFFGLITLGCLSALLMIFSFSRPVTRDLPDDITYEHQGAFDYSAQFPTEVYPAGQATAGQPVFPPLNCALDVIFDYHLVSDRPVQASFTYSLGATVRGLDGWQRDFKLQPVATAPYERIRSTGRLDLCAVLKAVDQMQVHTSIQQYPYTLALTPVIEARGTLDGREFSDRFTPQLAFHLDPLQLQLIGSGPDGQNSFTPVQKGVLKGTKTVANTLLILGRPLPVATGRVLSEFGLSLTVVIFLLTEIGFQERKTRADLAAGIRSRYGLQPVRVFSRPIHSGDRVIEVGSIDDLARLAVQCGSSILFYEQGDAIRYLAREGETVYAFSFTRPAASQEDEIARLGRELSLAIERGELQIEYQPSVSLANGRVAGVEALIRWHHPTRGVLTPQEFMPSAAAAGLAEQIDRWVLRTACEQLKNWQASLQSPVDLVVNLRPEEIQRRDLVQYVKKVLDETSLSPRDLQLELPLEEVHDTDTLRAGLLELRDIGVKVSLEDSFVNQPLDTLCRLPVDTFKIDTSGLPFDPGDLAAGLSTRALIAMAHDRNIQVSAAGIETPAQMDYWRSQNCDIVQGYAVCPPIPAAGIGQLIHETESQPPDWMTTNTGL